MVTRATTLFKSVQQLAPTIPQATTSSTKPSKYARHHAFSCHGPCSSLRTGPNTHRLIFLDFMSRLKHLMACGTNWEISNFLQRHSPVKSSPQVRKVHTISTHGRILLRTFPLHRLVLGLSRWSGMLNRHLGRRQRWRLRWITLLSSRRLSSRTMFIRL